MSKKGKANIKVRNKAQTKAANNNNAESFSSSDAAAPASASSSLQRRSSSSSNNKPIKTKVPPLSDMTADWVAETSEAILEQPDAAFSTVEEGDQLYASKVRQLLVAAASANSHVAQLAILSLLAIFMDILPAYRIRLPSVKEMAVKVSKDTKKLWDYERALLSHYQEYLQLLERAWTKESSSSSSSSSSSAGTPSPLGVTAVLCLCELLKNAYHFNFRSNLLTAVIRPMNHVVDQISIACCNAIRHVFQNDAQGEVALEATRQVAKMIRDKNFKVKPTVLQTFVSLPLRVHVDEAQAAKLAQQANAKKRKRDKETAAIEAELKEGHATADKIVLARAQSDALQAVTLTYFRILKTESHQSQLLPVALEGLAKFSHLINLETVMDLLDLLKSLLLKVDALPLDATLNCVLTAFSTLHGPGKELQLDVKEYVMPLYSQMWRFASESASAHTDLLLECLTAAFLKRREFSTLRTAAFCKQIWTVCLFAPPTTSVPLLAFARQLQQRYPLAIEQLLENEHDVITSGQYNPNVADPEHSNPLATSGWELSLLRFHYAPTVVSQATGAATCKLLQLPMEGPERLREQLLEDDQDLFISFTRLHKKHPLDAGSKQAKRARFLTPRHKDLRYISCESSA